MKNTEAKYRHFVMTLNNYQDYPNLIPTRLYEKVQYICFGREVAPSTGTPHLQMYAQMKHRIRKSTFESIFPSPIWA